MTKNLTWLAEMFETSGEIVSNFDTHQKCDFLLDFFAVKWR